MQLHIENRASLAQAICHQICVEEGIVCDTNCQEDFLNQSLSYSCELSNGQIVNLCLRCVELNEDVVCVLIGKPSSAESGQEPASSRKLVHSFIVNYILHKPNNLTLECKDFDQSTSLALESFVEDSNVEVNDEHSNWATLCRKIRKEISLVLESFASQFSMADMNSIAQAETKEKHKAKVHNQANMDSSKLFEKIKSDPNQSLYKDSSSLGQKHTTPSADVPIIEFDDELKMRHLYPTGDINHPEMFMPFTRRSGDIPHPFSIGHDDLYPPGLPRFPESLGPNLGSYGGMHPNPSHPIFGPRVAGSHGSRASEFGRRTGARVDPVGPGDIQIEGPGQRNMIRKHKDDSHIENDNTGQDGSSFDVRHMYY